MPSDLRWRVPLALVAVLGAAWHAFPLQERVNLGLDLQGGMHLVLRVDKSKAPPSARDQDLTEIALEVIRSRIDEFGVSEPVLQRQGPDHILVQLPGIPDRERALELVRKTAFLEFLLASQDRGRLSRALDGEVPRGYRLLEGRDGTPYLLETDEALTGEILADAWVETGQFGFPQVNFQMTRQGARRFGRLTGANVGRDLAIVLDGVVISAPQIKERIFDRGQITGQFTSEEAGDLAIVLRAGALPAPIEIEEERTVGPTLGRDSIQAGLSAIVLGGAVVVAFMMGYYWLSGMIAVLALLLNLLFILGGLGYFHATLTLPGIAGMILTLGMAVDANVLIYERIREELKAGRPLSLAIDAGYGKALSAIVDSNVTTLVAAFFLWWFGTGPIRGFATTLAIGITASLFTALFVTRIVFDLLLGAGVLKRLPMLQLIGQTRFDFIGKRYICWGLSLLVVFVGMAAFIARGEARYGIDFTGGLLQEYRFAKPLEAEALRGTLQRAEVPDALIQRFGSPREWLIRTADDSDETVSRTREAIQTDYGESEPQLLRLERVGPTVGAILRRKAWFAIGWSMLGILIYVAVRFRHLDFGLAALAALAHDVVLTTGVLCLTQREIDLVIVAALMTIAGYSVNDTIVVYDRVRENSLLNRKLKLTDLINVSVNQTLSRTVLTSLTTLVVVVALFVVGGAALRNFAFALIVGFMTGIYSSVYIATGFVVILRQMFAARQASA